MRKLYFQKLVRGIKYVLIFLAVYIFGANVLVTIANFFKDHPLIQSLILLGIPAVIVFIMASSKRLKDRDHGKQYKKDLGDRMGNLKSELGYVLMSDDYKAELLSAVTYVVLFTTVMLLAGGFANFVSRLVSDLIIGGIFLLAYALGNLLSWLYVHRKYAKDELI